jgi:hypothetical protein
MQKYAKAIVAILGATLTVVASIYDIEWLPIVIAFVTAFGVYMVPNLPGDPGVPDSPGGTTE